MTAAEGSRPLRRLVSLVSLVAACSLLAASCAATADGNEPSDVEHSGVGIVAGGCGLAQRVGSGVVVDRGNGQAVVVTVAHTISGATEVVVVDVDGNENAARVVAFDKDADLAALDVPALDVPGLASATGSVAATIDGTEGSVLTWGRDEGVERVPVVIAKRLRVTIEDIYVDEVVERNALEIAGPVTVGDSGGPVLDAVGDVVGIMYASSRRREQVGFATDQVELAGLLGSITDSTVANGTCA